MAVLVRNSIQEITQQLFRSIHLEGVKHVSCGIILAPCANVNQRTLDLAKSFISKKDPSLSVQFVYDDQNEVLCGVLEEGTLCSTHYASLALKDFLQQQQLLQGTLLVSSFPENGIPTESTIAKMVQQAVGSKGNEQDIHFYTAANAETSVLIADTDDIVREFIKIRLELKGYRVYEAKDGQEAYNAFMRFTPDLVITELNLPILDGYQLIRMIQRNDANEGKVIVLTDKQLAGDMNRAYELGAADYVTKPLSISELEWKVKRLTSMQLV